MKTLSVKRGFTLIELLVVVAIISMLSSVILVSLNSAKVKARDARVMSDVSQIRNELELVVSNSGNYANTEGLTATEDTYYVGGVISSLLGDMTMYGATNSFIRHPGNKTKVYVITTTLPGGDKYCIDSSGKVTDTVALQGASVCP